MKKNKPSNLVIEITIPDISMGNVKEGTLLECLLQLVESILDNDQFTISLDREEIPDEAD